MERKKAIEVIKKNWPDSSFTMLREALETLIPELKESEDERIRKIIKQSLKSYFDGKLSIGTNDVDYAICLSWLEKQGNLMKALQISNANIGELIEKNYYLKEQLEKQGEHAKFKESIQIGDKVTRNEDGVLVNLSQLNRVAKKQGEQKSAKFDDTNAKRMFIKALERVEEQNAKGYKLTDCDKNSWWEDFKAFCSEQNLANSAKTCKDEQKPAEEYNITGIGSKNAQGKLGEMIKNLKQEELTEFEKAIKQVMEEAIECGDTHNLKADADMLLRLVQKPTWGEDDEHGFENCLYAIKETFEGVENPHRVGTINWLNSLKDRVQPQPKQEWSEEDERRIEECAREAEDNSYIILAKHIRQLKSFRPQTRWKPSDEQMVAISTAIGVLGQGTINGQYLIELQEQLLKLREE